MNTPLSIIGALSPNRQSNPTLRSLRSLRCYRTRLTDAYLATLRFAQIRPIGRTSDTRRTLGEMRLPHSKNFYEHRFIHNRHQEESQ